MPRAKTVIHYPAANGSRQGVSTTDKTLTVRQVAESLLPESSEQKIDAGVVGVLGAFEVYRGSLREHRMANLRIILR